MKYLSFSLLFILLACVEIPESPTPPEYSVYCLVSPDESLIKAFVAKTYKIGESISLKGDNAYKNAIVSIAEGSNKKTLALNKETGWYELPNEGFIKPKLTYRLEVKANGQTLQSTCTVPATWNEIEFTEKGKGNDYEFGLKWADEASQQNFYKLIGYTTEKTIDSNEYGIKWGSNSYHTVSFNDKNTNGNFLSSPIGTIPPYGGQGKYLVVECINMEKNMGSFEEKAHQQTFSDDFTSKFKEPVIVPTNILNGTGIFGAYTKSTITRIIP